MIGWDKSIFPTTQSVGGDSLGRHIKYAEALRHSTSNGQLTIAIRTPRGTSDQPINISNALVAFPIPCSRWAFPYAALRILTPILKNTRFDLVTTQTPFDDGLVGLWLKHRHGIPLNAQMRSSFLDMPNWINQRPVTYRVLNAIGKRVIHKADTIRVISNGEKARLSDKFPQKSDRIHALHPLVNTHIFSNPVTTEEGDRVQTEMNQSGLGGSPYILYVGRLVKEKNIGLLLTAFASIRVSSPDLTLVVAGDGPLRETLIKQATDLKISNRIKWLGNISLGDLRGWYANAEATVLPSLQEGFGKVIVESYLMSTPVVTTPFVSAPELILNNETGFITNSFIDPTDLSNKVTSLLASSKQSQLMGSRGRDHIKEYLIPDDAYMNKLLKIWEHTVRSTGAQSI
ncbi:glycosyltransferase family 4 protein [Dehalococcoidia bacterium]|nr:glycosyltransferase family 4 protein [Dehalococcoidia bacterium]